MNTFNEEKNALIMHDEDESNMTMPLGIGEGHAGEVDSFATESSSSKFRSGSLLLVVVIALAAAGLFGMRMITQISVPATALGEVESTIDDYLKAIGNDAQPGDSSSAIAENPAIVTDERVFTVLSDDFTDRQVPVSDVQRDPFVIYGIVAPPPAANTTGDGGKAQLEQQRKDWFAAVQTATDKLKLKSVLMSSKPMAKLDNELVRIGDRVDLGDFEHLCHITAIDQHSLTLLVENAALELSFEKAIEINKDSLSSQGGGKVIRN